jgi:hypothetical protein
MDNKFQACYFALPKSTDALFVCSRVFQVRPPTMDACGVCGGDNVSCTGCDGVLHSALELDACGVCGKFYSLHPALYTQLPTPYTPRSTSTSYTPHPTPYTPHCTSTSYTLHSTPHTPNLEPWTLCVRRGGKVVACLYLWSSGESWSTGQQEQA